MYAIGLTDVSTIGEVCLLYYFPFVFVIFIEKELLETLESRLDRGLIALGYCWGFFYFNILESIFSRNKNVWKRQRQNRQN